VISTYIIPPKLQHKRGAHMTGRENNKRAD
jgi:hypothetical protein